MSWQQELREQWYALLAGDGPGAQSAFNSEAIETDITPFADLRLPDSLRGPVIAAARKARLKPSSARGHLIVTASCLDD